MKAGTNYLFRASSLLLILSCIVCVVAEPDDSEIPLVNGFLELKYDVLSPSGSGFVSYAAHKSSDTLQAGKPERMIGNQMMKTLRRKNRKHRKKNMSRRDMVVLDKPRIAENNNDRIDRAEVPDELEGNQFTFTSQASPGLVVQVKPFVRFRGDERNRRSTVSYKVYVLEGMNVRHYRVEFPSRELGRAAFNIRRRVARCIRRRYLKRCIDLPLPRKGACTTRIVRKCVPGFVVFEDASPVTLGTSASNPLPSATETVSPSPLATADS